MNMLKSMGAISTETIMEKSDLIASKDIEMKRIKKEQKEEEKKQEKVMEQQGFNNQDSKDKDE